MSSIPLAALAVQPPPQQPSAISQLGQVMQLKDLMQNQPLRNQELQQRVTAGEQENQIRAQQIQDQQTLRTLSPNHVQKDADGNVTGFDMPGLIKEAASKQVSPTLLNQMGAQYADSVTKMAQIPKTQREEQQAQNKASYEALESIRAIPDPAGRQQALQQVLPNLQKQGVDTSKIPTNVPLTDSVLNTYEAGLGMHAQVLSDADTQSKINQANAKARLDNMEAASKGSPLTAMENDPSQMAGDKLPAAMGYLQSKIADPNVDPVDKARATRLLSTAQTVKQNQLAMDASKKATEQSIADGDPIAAGKLLFNGTVAPSQIISARKPEFAQKAMDAAATLGQQAGKPWNAQQAEANFKVASSSQQVAFFGSAKSLTDKGGTLDQLAAAAKDIPQGQIPVFNSIADATQASLGSGPIAKYASILLGVSDDYSKVMGGGQGSDLSRNQALGLVPAKASPEARDAAIEGIRGAVGSQINSRIGSNPVLKQMYGSQIPETAKSGAAHPFFSQFGGTARPQ